MKARGFITAPGSRRPPDAPGGVRNAPLKGAAGPVLAALALLGGCATGPPAPVNFRCADDSRFALRVDGAGQRADIMFGGMSFVLRRAHAATGRRYTCDVLSVWVDGDVAQLDIQGSVHQCRTLP